jgi:hypothetical protein
VVDGVFEVEAGGTDADTDLPPSPASVNFHPATDIGEPGVAQVQAILRRRILRAFVGRALLESFEALVPPPRTYRHHYFGVLAPNSPLRSAVTALAQGAPAPPAAAQAGQAPTGEDEPAKPVLSKRPAPMDEARKPSWTGIRRNQHRTTRSRSAHQSVINL